MRKFSSGWIGVDQGSRMLFSDFVHGGVMWTGEGNRESRHAVTFKDGFAEAPVIHLSLTMWDMDHKTNSRVDLVAENITPTGFDIVFRTWADTRIARARADWMAIGPVSDEDHWDVV